MGRYSCYNPYVPYACAPPCGPCLPPPCVYGPYLPYGPCAPVYGCFR